MKCEKIGQTAVRNRDKGKKLLYRKEIAAKREIYNHQDTKAWSMEKEGK